MTWEEMSKLDLLFEAIEKPYFKATYGEHEIVLEVGDFPAEPMWIIYIDGEDVGGADYLPNKWTIPGYKD